MPAIGERVGIRGPSIYKHVASKQQLLVEIMYGQMEELFSRQQHALVSSTNPLEQVRRMMEAHVRYHATHWQEAFVGIRELSSLEEPHRATIVQQRKDYERVFRKVVADGVARGVFAVESPRMTSYALLDMGLGVSTWFRPGGEFSEDQLAYSYADMAVIVLTSKLP